MKIMPIVKQASKLLVLPMLALSIEKIMSIIKQANMRLILIMLAFSTVAEMMPPSNKPISD